MLSGWRETIMLEWKALKQNLERLSGTHDWCISNSIMGSHALFARANFCWTIMKTLLVAHADEAWDTVIYGEMFELGRML